MNKMLFVCKNAPKIRFPAIRNLTALSHHKNVCYEAVFLGVSFNISATATFQITSKI